MLDMGIHTPGAIPSFNPPADLDAFWQQIEDILPVNEARVITEMAERIYSWLKVHGHLADSTDYTIKRLFAAMAESPRQFVDVPRR